MIGRRRFFLGACATLLSAPVIVRVESLMQVRGITYPVERHSFGFVERLYVYTFVPKITEMQSAGLSAYGIATELNKLGITTATNPGFWDAQHVMFVVRKNQSIQREDAIRRAELMNSTV